MANQKRNIDDLITDPKFMDWLAEPNVELDAHWSQWLKVHPNRSEDLAEAKDFVSSFHFEEKAMPAHSKQKMMANIESQIKDQSTSVSINRRTWLSIAASIALLIAAFLFINRDSGYYAVPYGEIEKIDLPDGSKVTVNANSSIRYQPNWTKESIREVWLSGEALFEVSAQPKKGTQQFIVHTDRGQVHVLGTTFNVKSRKNHFSVMLTEGAVELSLSEDAQAPPVALTMKPGELVDLDINTKTYRTSHPNPEVYTAWTQRKLVCDNTSIAYLASIIEDEYSYEVLIEEEALLERKLSGTLNNPSLDDLIQAISLSFNIKVEKNTSERRLRISY